MTFKPSISTISINFVNSKLHFGELGSTHKVIEGDPPIWKPLGWKTNFAP
jgi:hypothetical protein